MVNWRGTALRQAKFDLSTQEGTIVVNLALNRIRARSTTPTPALQKWLEAAFALVLGGVLGYLAKYFDGVPLLADLVTYMGLWILIGTVLAAWARSPRAAALHVFLFFAAMLVVYYIYYMILYGVFAGNYFIGWGILALASPLGAYLTWYARGEGWPAALCAAAPIGLLINEGYRFLSGPSLTELFDLLAALFLLFALTGKWSQRAKILPVALAIFVILWKLHLVNLFYMAMF